MLRTLRLKMTCSRATLVPLICMLTVLTYVDFFPGIIRYNLSYVVWILVLVECAITCRIRLKKVALSFIAYGLAFVGIIALFELFSTNDYLRSGVVYSIFVALLVFLCGVLLGNKLTVEDIEVICRWYVLGAAMLALILVINLRGNFGITSRVYGGLNKNSVGQILSTAATILMIGVSSKKGRNNTLIRVGVSVFLIIILFLIRSRTCILCFAASILIMLLSRYTNKKLKRWILAAMMGVLIVLLVNPGFRTILFTNILFANRDATSLDALTSGRISIYSQFASLMKDHGLIGNGARYYESFYLSVIVQFGYPVGLYLWGYVFYMLHLIRKSQKYVSYGWLLVIISISYSLNGIFEGLPPFGPGTKNFLLWLLFGFAITHANYDGRKVVKEEALLWE